VADLPGHAIGYDGSRPSHSNFRQRTGFTPEELAGKLILDVGCGMGRFAEVARSWGAYVIGIDLRRAGEAAQENLRDREAVFSQAHVFHLPFVPESFDYVDSIGVLHHTPNCEQAFKVLPGLLKPAVALRSGSTADTTSGTA